MEIPSQNHMQSAELPEASRTAHLVASGANARNVNTFNNENGGTYQNQVSARVGAVAEVPVQGLDLQRADATLS